MKKILFLLCISTIINISLRSCGSASAESEMVSQETAQNISEEEIVLLNPYKELLATEKIERASLIYLDQDTVPELLVLKAGEYRLYSLDGSAVKEILMPDTRIKADAYGPGYGSEDSEHPSFYWFEYVPYEGLMRVHSREDQEKHDYYLRYTDGVLELELETNHAGNKWHTYDAEGEIANENFLSQLTALGYDKLIPCEYLYENIETAYENIGATSDAQKVLDDFVCGKTDALDHVEKIDNIPEEGFVRKSYQDFYDDINDADLAGEDISGTVEYTDFDNDGEKELIMRNYIGTSLFFDVIGDTVYKVLETGGTADTAYVAKRNGKQVIARTDLLHGGRKSYRIMEYDSCCCLIDWFHLYAEYTGENYSENDRFQYRDHAITMAEYEEIRDSIQ